MTDPDLLGARRGEPALAPDQATPDALPEVRQAAGRTPGAAPGQTPERHGVPPDPGCYQIRFGLGLRFGLPLIWVGIIGAGRAVHGHGLPVFWLLGVIAVGGVFTLLTWPLSRKIVFRADHAGITLGPKMPTFHFSSTTLIPWADVRQITLYKLKRPSVTVRRWPGRYVGIVPRQGASAGPAARRIWQLDRERLAAVTAAAAPGVRIVDAGEIDPWDDAGRAILREVGRWP